METNVTNKRLQPLAGLAWNQDGYRAQEPDEPQPQGRHEPYLSVVFLTFVNKHVVTQCLLLFMISILLMCDKQCSRVLVKCDKHFS